MRSHIVPLDIEKSATAVSVEVDIDTSSGCLTLRQVYTIVRRLLISAYRFLISSLLCCSARIALSIASQALK